MTDKKKMSIEDILAACRGGEPGPSAGAGSQPSPPADVEPGGSSSAESAPAKPPKAAGPAGSATPKAPGSMSVADILAAARSSSAPAESGGSEEPKAAPAKPAASKPAAGGAMNVADILAAARGAGTAPAAKPAAPKPASAESKPKAAAKAPAAKSESGAAATVDTSSILAAARKGTKAGPISKAEAAALPAAGAAKAAKPALLPMPEKPAYAMAKPASATTATSRRGFFEVFFGSFLALGFTAFGLTNLLWVLGLTRFLFPNILIEPPSRFRVGFPGDFAPGSVSEKFKAQFGIWIVNAEYEGQPQIVALKTVCTHLGCTPNWLDAEQKFKCPCHGSGFYKDGVNFEGPAPRPLERYAIQIAADGQLEVDKSKTFQQELGQWSNPSCYVIV